MCTPIQGNLEHYRTAVKSAALHGMGKVDGDLTMHKDETAQFIVVGE